MATSEGEVEASTRLELAFSAVAGILTVAFLVLLALAIQSRVEIINFFYMLTPFTLGFAGLGVGHYLGLSFDEESTDRSLFFLGAFLMLCVVLGYSSQTPLFGVVPSYSILVGGALASISFHLSGLLDNHEDFEETIYVLSGDVSRAYLIILTIAKYSISFISGIIPDFSGWTEFELVAGAGFLLLAIFVGAFAFGAGLSSNDV